MVAEPSIQPSRETTLDLRSKSSNAISVDVEDYYHAWALSSAIPPDKRDRWPVRVTVSTRRVLELFTRHNIRATFFILGEVARAHPDLIRAIAADGHEIASHGYAHDKISDLTPDAFFADIDCTRKLLQDQTGAEIAGYRAPSFSIGRYEWWAYDELVRAGYSYSSSLHPIPHDHYGMPDAPRHPFHPLGPDVDMIEIPVATISLAGRPVTCAGGGFFRFWPYVWSQHCLKRHGPDAVFYFHPWEIDPDQPRIKGLPLKSRFRHYVNLARMERKLERLAGDFAWGRVDEMAMPETGYPVWQPIGTDPPHIEQTSTAKLGGA